MVRVEPAADNTSNQLPQGVQPGQVYVDPETGELLQLTPVNSTQATRRPGNPVDQMVMDMGYEPGTNIQRFRGETLWVRHPDGSKQQVSRGYVEDITHKQAPKSEADDEIPNAISKKKIFIGVMLVILIVMILADVVGVPHVRIAPGEYASLEGVKVVDDPDGALVILKRLDRSVFLYTIDGIGWTFRKIAGS
tara:strand:+ start:748 stop:1326 length:579 start_codon:yes stop_codon:yes gene_type:complete